MSEDRLEQFGAYVEALAEVIGHADRMEPLRDYCRSLLLPGDRKSVEPIAAVTAPARASAKHQSLLHFVANAPWSNERIHPVRTAKTTCLLVVLAHRGCRIGSGARVFNASVSDRPR